MTLLELLQTYTPFDAGEAESVRQLRTFLASLAPSQDAFGRELVGAETLRGHVTGSAWLVNGDNTRVVMLYHGKLNKWVQPGGHCDGDSDVLRVAMREAREETGLNVRPLDLELWPWEKRSGQRPKPQNQSPILNQSPIFDIDAHAIPEYWNTPAHTHFDVRFLLRADDAQTPVVSHESRQVRWVLLEEAAHLNGSASIARMIAKTRQLRAF